MRDVVGGPGTRAVVGLLTAVMGFTWRGVFLVMGVLSLAAAFFALRLKDPGWGRWDTGQVRAAVRTREHGDVEGDLQEEEVALGFFEIVRRARG